ncbi:MAG TPA: elongation factor 4 [Candidatus Portnoybacteria bacterium]|nr:elongation factor 4 [Candidatus Portnoybacteria bacterium]
MTNKNLIGNNIRNFVIIAHIDHGKSTLADRFLELTKTVQAGKMKAQYLDQMDLERERGITIKMTPVQMVWYTPNHPEILNPKFEIQNKSQILNTKSQTGNSEFILNLIDTPGHADFSYEVSRSLAAVEGAILLVDATQGVQAQTLSNFQMAKKRGLVIIPVINKIDLPEAIERIEDTENEIRELINDPSVRISRVSAKTGKGVEEVLLRIIQEIPAPKINPDQPFRALVFDSFYDYYKGVIAHIRVVDGQINPGDQIMMMASSGRSQVVEIGHFKPELYPEKFLATGDIGYLATGLKDIKLCRVGETIVALPAKNNEVLIKPLLGYQEPKPMIFASLYLEDVEKDFEELRTALQKLNLNDAALVFEPESSTLGRGFKCGFLGMLHLEIVAERLKREFNLNLTITSPSVSYLVKLKNGLEKTINSISDLPDSSEIQEIEEPFCQLEILAPTTCLGNILRLMGEINSLQRGIDYLGQQRVILKYQAPLREIVVDFYDRLKSVTSGYASMSYEIIDYRSADLVKLDVLINGEKIDSLAQVALRSNAYHQAAKLSEKLKKLIPPKLFAIPIQVAIGGKIIARETIRARRKDVTGYLYGGDYTRKRKLLEKQKKGKKRMKQMGKVKIPPDVFLKINRK